MRLREAAAKIIEEADKEERQPGKPSNDPYEAAYGELIAEKCRKLGFKL